MIPSSRLFEVGRVMGMYSHPHCDVHCVHHYCSMCSNAALKLQHESYMCTKFSLATRRLTIQKGITIRCWTICDMMNSYLLQLALLVWSCLDGTQAFSLALVGKDGRSLCTARGRIQPRTSSSLQASSTIVSTTSNDVAMIQERIEECIRLQQDPKPALLELEALNDVSEPNRCPQFMGEWHVWYTNCPPPSNGQLGPFQGTASQVIPPNDSLHSYQNLLAVPPNNWLTATLDGIWEEWDGNLLRIPKDRNERSPTPSPLSPPEQRTGDWGACHWKVTFLQLQIALLGFPIVTQKFPPFTSRIWRTTYLDNEIRIVRAGKTGRPEDEYVFYTRRTPPPTL